jgi:hypothetical protein
MATGICLDQDQNGIDCSDPNCTYGDCVTAGAAGSTVTANPSVPPSMSASSSAANDLSQMSNVMGQWGATIAGIVTHTPTVTSPTGARTGSAAVGPVTTLTSGNGLLLLLVVGVVVLVLVMK